jgi:hypothetical protein
MTDLETHYSVENFKAMEDSVKVSLACFILPIIGFGLTIISPLSYFLIGESASGIVKFFAFVCVPILNFITFALSCLNVDRLYKKFERDGDDDKGHAYRGLEFYTGFKTDKNHEISFGLQISSFPVGVALFIFFLLGSKGELETFYIGIAAQAVLIAVSLYYTYKMYEDTKDVDFTDCFKYAVGKKTPETADDRRAKEDCSTSEGYQEYYRDYNSSSESDPVAPATVAPAPAPVATETGSLVPTPTTESEPEYMVPPQITVYEMYGE